MLRRRVSGFAAERGLRRREAQQLADCVAPIDRDAPTSPRRAVFRLKFGNLCSAAADNAQRLYTKLLCAGGPLPPRAHRVLRRGHHVQGSGRRGLP